MRQIHKKDDRAGTRKTNQDNELARISAIPAGQNSWRVDWLGDLSYPDRTVLLDSRSTTAKQKGVWIPVGTLPLPKVEEIWRDRQLEFCPDYELETFHGLQIDRDTTSLIKAGLNLDNEGFLIRLKLSCLHRATTTVGRFR